MAEAGNTPQQHRFYCHCCKCETNPKLPDLVCPTCKSGFIEEVPANSSLLRDSTASYESENSSSLLSDLFQLLFIGNSALLSSPSSTESDSIDTEDESAGPNDYFSRSEVTTERGEQESSSVSEGETSSSPEENSSMDGIIQQFLSDSFANNRRPAAAPTALASMLQMYSNPEDYAWGLGGLDTVITELLGQLENTGPPPATQEEISALPTVCISQEQIDCRLGCPVCREEYCSGETVRKLPCLHFFHNECIVPWLKLHNSCPVCRKSLDGVDNSLPPTSEPPE
uniref:RING-type E3 ubiquitin transferase n=2 Tax=Iconisemion striatum TaxID=60296 RepID=A0A1A7XRZ0_9TELE